MKKYAFITLLSVSFTALAIAGGVHHSSGAAVTNIADTTPVHHTVKKSPHESTSTHHTMKKKTTKPAKDSTTKK